MRQDQLCPSSLVYGLPSREIAKSNKMLLAACGAPVAAPTSAPKVVAEAVEPTILAEGAPVHPAGNLAFGPDGNLYVATWIGREIVVLDPNNGEILERFDPEDGIEFPGDLVFGPDDSLYWAIGTSPTGQGGMGRMSPDGVVSSQSMPRGTWPLAFSDDDRLFAGQIFGNNSLYEIDPDFEDKPKRLTSLSGGVGDLEFGPDGFLYAANRGAGEILRIDMTAEPVQTEVVAEGLLDPTSILFDDQGRLHLVEHEIGQVSVLDLESGIKEILVTEPGLWDLAMDESGREFVSVPGDGSIYEILADDTLRTVSPGGMVMPGGVAVVARSEEESVYVAGWTGLQEYDGANGRLLSTVGSDSGGLLSPLTVSPIGDYLLVTSWWGDPAIQIWDPQKQVEMKQIKYGGAINAIEFQGDVVVAGRVVRRLNGDNLDDLSQRSTLADSLRTPAGLAATEDNLWVGDYATGEIFMLAAAGEILDEPILFASGLEGPEGMALTSDGRLLVVETHAGRLSAIELLSGEMTTVMDGLDVTATGPQDMPDTWVFNGVAVGPSGTIYVTADRANLVYRIPSQ